MEMDSTNRIKYLCFIFFLIHVPHELSAEFLCGTKEGNFTNNLYQYSMVEFGLVLKQKMPVIGTIAENYSVLPLPDLYLFNTSTIMRSGNSISGYSARLEQSPAGQSIVIIVPTRPDSQKDLWIFAKPLSWCLWLTMGIASIILGLVLVFLECRVKNAKFGGPLHEKLFMLFWFPFTLLVFQERRMANKWSKVVVFIWLYMAFIVTQCYVAKLFSILTEDQRPQVFPDQYNYVGYRDGSSIKKLLMKEFGLKESQLKSYSNIEEYHLALSKGSSNGGIDAIFDELLYANLFINKYGSQYVKIGPITKAVGFGFAFSTGSHYHFNFPTKSLNVDESSKVGELRKILHHQYQLYQQIPSTSSQSQSQSQSLSAYNFGGLFIITGISILLAIICSEYSIWRNSIQSLLSNSIDQSSVQSAFEMIEVSGDFNTVEAQQDTSSSPCSPTNEDASINQEE